MFENSIIRKAKGQERPYFLVSRSAVQDERLSVKARGLLAYILSLPDTWQIRFSELLRHFPDGRFVIRGAFNELKVNGYIIGRRVKDEKGIIRGHEFFVFEDPCGPEEVKDRLTRYEGDAMYRQSYDAVGEE